MSFYPKLTGKYSAKTKKRALKLMLAGAFLVIILMGGLFMRGSFIENDPETGKISVSMTAQVYRDGELLEERIRDEDLILENFANFTSALLTWPNDADVIIEMTETTGGHPNWVIWSASSDETIFDVDNSNAVTECRIGDGNTPPDPKDHGLDSDIWDMPLDSSTQGSGYFTLTYIWVNNQGAFTWVETGNMIDWWCDDGDEQYTIMLSRDVFSGIGVINGDTLVVNYRYNFASGYTTNAVTLFHYILKGASQDSSTSTTFTDTSGSSRTITIYTATATTDYVCHYESTDYGGHLLVSTSSSGIPARDAYRILGSSLSTYCTSVLVPSPLAVEISAIFVPTVEITVTAGAYYRYTEHSGGGGYFMLFALAHSGVYVPAGTPVKATFTMGMS